MIKKVLLVGLLLITLVGLPLTVYVFQNRTRLESKASGGTSLSLIPQPGTSSSIEKTVGNIFAVDLMLDPANNAVTGIRLQVKYDANYLEPVPGNPFTPTNDFPVVIEGPYITGGMISEAISVGNDSSRAVITSRKIGTFNFRAIGKTPEGMPTLLSFTNQTKAYSSGSNDQAAEDILTNASPSQITILDVVPTATLTPTPTVTPSPTLTPTPTPTETPTPTPTVAPQITQFNLTAFLHGIGNSGDNTNPNAYSLSNKNPNNRRRNVTISVYNANDQKPALITKTGTMDYDDEDGNFKGTISLGTILATGDYIIRIKTDSFLQKRVPGFISVVSTNPVYPVTVTLVNGDPNYDTDALGDRLNLVDYHMIIGCYSDFAPPKFCDETKAVLTDLNDDGHVNQIDYNLYLREITVQGGN